MTPHCKLDGRTHAFFSRLSGVRFEIDRTSIQRWPAEAYSVVSSLTWAGLSGSALFRLRH